MDKNEDDPRIDSELTWDQVRLPPQLTEAEFDKVIFSMLNPQWRKVAAIVIRVVEKYEHINPAITFELVAARLRALSNADRIEAQGDLRMWRHSEVRLKG
jgi:hypothetical protein